MGLSSTRTALRRKHWLVKGTGLIKRIIKSCWICKIRKNNKKLTVQMAPLPEVRLNLPIMPFSKCGIDVAGPIYNDEGIKRYLLIITCLQIRGIIIRLLENLEESSLHVEFSEVVVRAREIKIVLSDSAKYFLSLSKKFTEIDWQFIPPYSPHRGGIYERMVGVTKAALKCFDGLSCTDKNLRLQIMAAEHAINSRPIVGLLEDPEQEPMTPFDFIAPSYPAVLNKEQFKLKNKNFAEKWTAEYKQELMNTNKWQRNSKELKERMYVMIKNKRPSSGYWTVGKIKSLRRNR